MKKSIGLLIALLSLCVPAHAGGDHDRARLAVEEGRILPLSQIVARAESAYSGQLIEAELEEESGVIVYEIKLLTPNSRLIKVFYDARTGEPLPEKDRRER